MTAKSKRPLSRSQYLSGAQCPRRLWRDAHPAPVTDQGGLLRRVRRRESDRVLALARERFPDAVVVAPTEHTEHAAITTRAALASGRSVMGGVVAAPGVTTRVRLLEHHPDGVWVVDIHSGVRVRKGHLVDAAFQTAVVRAAGLTVLGTAALHLRRSWRKGRGDPSRVFVRRDITDAVATCGIDLTHLPAHFQRVLGLPDEPAVRTGDHCLSPWRCPHANACRAPIKPAARIPMAGRAAAAAGEPWHSDALADKLRVEGPVTFLDFEAYSPALPPTDNLGPYPILPFLWAMSVQDADGTVRQDAHLSPAADPRREFATTLVAALPPTGAIVVWSGYEARTISRLAQAMPDLAPALKATRARIVDLLAIAREHVWSPTFNGSYSLKAVAPALVPSLGWQDLEVNGGLDAALLALGTQNGALNPEEIPPLRASLQDYCLRDADCTRQVYNALVALADAPAGPPRPPKRDDAAVSTATG